MRDLGETYRKLLDGNRRFVAESLKRDPEFFDKLAHAQKPGVLWIGCSDSRVPADRITDMQPGQIFVHRNISNMVVHTDVNVLSVVDYAVSYLNVEHVIVCGHYGCGGIAAALSNRHFGLIDNWLRNIKDVYRLHHQELEAIQDPAQRERRLVELNVIEQVYNLCKTSILQKAWRNGNRPHLHGWVYDVSNGLIQDLNVNLRGVEDLARIYLFDV